MKRLAPRVGALRSKASPGPIHIAHFKSCAADARLRRGPPHSGADDTGFFGFSNESHLNPGSAVTGADALGDAKKKKSLPWQVRGFCDRRRRLYTAKNNFPPPGPHPP